MTPEGKEKLKQALSKQGEKGAIVALETVYAVAEVYVEDTTNPLDNLLLDALKQLDGLLKDGIDKIDGIDNI